MWSKLIFCSLIYLAGFWDTLFPSENKIINAEHVKCSDTNLANKLQEWALGVVDLGEETTLMLKLLINLCWKL